MEYGNFEREIKDYKDPETDDLTVIPDNSDMRKTEAHRIVSSDKEKKPNEKPPEVYRHGRGSTEEFDI
jgi:hypothetical protein